MNWQTATFPTSIHAGQDHGSYGYYAGVARSESGTDAGAWQLTLRQGYPAPDAPLGEGVALPVIHEVTVQSRRHAEYVLNAWVCERLAPEVHA
ncbi:hypothetical protein [Luteitalea sp.]